MGTTPSRWAHDGERLRWNDLSCPSILRRYYRGLTTHAPSPQSVAMELNHQFSSVIIDGSSAIGGGLLSRRLDHHLLALWTPSFNR